ncbi:RAMP superfamily CRISPR-associated protein [Fundicoccus ignavus]|uniref:RAMP superfamily CRISPR-associated protein n=1 Tax=Fundicoccus ignavus TaxID=2664442 RepID=UPI00129CC91D|nr:RAMP superfamily CRISPR-associated protein [Fundicoccus ignavus]
MSSPNKTVSLQAVNLDTLTTVITNEIKFKVVTPLAIHGADSKNDTEIRIQSLNGIFRYWSRVLRVNNLSNHSQQVENIVFGNASDSPTKGKVQLRLLALPAKIQKVRYSPSSTGNFAINALAPNTDFSLQLAITEAPDISLNNIPISIKDYTLALCLLTSLIGGFGQRSRHGVGSVDALMLKSRFQSLESFASAFKILAGQLNLETDFNQPVIRRVNSDSQDGAPYWKETHLIDTELTDYQDLLIRIKEATHQLSGRYRDVIGSARPRVPSPLHTAVTLKTDNTFLVTVSEVFNPNMRTAVTRYAEAKAFYIEQLKEELYK